MDQWQYTTSPFPGAEGSKKYDERLAELNRLGKEGWEVVSTHSVESVRWPNGRHVVLLKRRLA